MISLMRLFAGMVGALGLIQILLGFLELKNSTRAGWEAIFLGVFVFLGAVLLAGFAKAIALLEDISDSLKRQRSQRPAQQQDFFPPA